jgi:hypothetical protein
MHGVCREQLIPCQGDPKTPLSQRPKLSKDEWNTLISRINEISKMMIDENMPLSLSPSHGNRY